MNDDPLQPEVYLGDGLYASHDGWHIILRTPRIDGDHWVGLEPVVLAAFIDYAARVNNVLVGPLLTRAKRNRLFEISKRACEDGSNDSANFNELYEVLEMLGLDPENGK